VHPLIGVDELAAALTAAPRPVLLDVRWRLGGPPGLEEYRAGHLPGAHFVDLDTELAGPPGPHGRHPLPDAGIFAAAMSRSGVHAGTYVVVYDGADGTAAARCWWLLRWFGHHRVRVLDGGYRGWLDAGQPTEAGQPTAGPLIAGTRRAFQPAPGGMPVLDPAGAAALARSGLLLDARAAGRYRGEVEPVDPVAGHIPGAVSAPVTDSLGPDGRLRGRAELASRFAALGATSDVRVGVYCGSGVTAAWQVLALETVGIRAALYPGSWSEWVADPDRPVATGADPD
jgi:thiosulfate/3-mercaptopyruvate sulfurtransferase